MKARSRIERGTGICGSAGTLGWILASARGLIPLMCDGDSFDDMVAYRLRRELLSRRGFGSLSLGAGLASLLPIGCKSAGPAPDAASTAASGAAITPRAGAVATT